uniref:Uncharacterized protein n=1 Tax=Astyanax mexicanus TaxID=7994 RepID=A0A8B9KXA2_ASTMX
MAQVDQGWSGDKDDLHHPEADVADGELPVVAHILTTGLHDALRSRPQDQDPEDEEDAHPYLPNHSGVGLHLVHSGLLSKHNPYPGL